MSERATTAAAATAAANKLSHIEVDKKLEICCGEGGLCEGDGVDVHDAYEVLALLQQYPEFADRLRALYFIPIGLEFEPSKADGITINTYLDQLNLSGNEREQWEQAFRDGNEVVPLVIALTITKNLEKLELFGIDFNTKDYKPYFDKVFQLAADPHKTSILTNLKDVSLVVNADDAIFFEDETVLHHLVLIPSVQKLQGSRLGIDTCVPIEYKCVKDSAGAVVTSNIEKVELDESFFCPHDLLEFLKPLVKLKWMDFSCAFYQFKFVDCMSGECCEKYTKEEKQALGWEGLHSQRDAPFRFRQCFEKVVGPLLHERGLKWKIVSFESWNPQNGVKIRAAESAHELDEYNEPAAPVKNSADEVNDHNEEGQLKRRVVVHSWGG